MSPREEKGRQLIAELAEFLRTGDYPNEAEQLLNGLTQYMRQVDFKEAIVGEGHLVADPKLFLTLMPTPQGLRLGMPGYFGAVMDVVNGIKEGKRGPG